MMKSRRVNLFKEFFSLLNHHIRMYRRHTPVGLMGIFLAFSCLIYSWCFALGVSAVNPFLTVVGIVGLAVTLYAHRPNFHTND